MSLSKLVIGLAAGAAASAATAQSTDSSQPFDVTGNVPTLCSIGSLGGDDGAFALGTLIDLSTGKLRQDLSAEDKVLTGAFCTARSTIEIVATPLLAESDPSVPTGFSKGVHFTAKASGWTETPASYDTAAATHPDASQTRTSAFQGDITVGIDDFRTMGGDNLLLVADPSYLGSVVVTVTSAD